MSYNFDIKEFPPFYGRIVIPKGTVLYRGFCTEYRGVPKVSPPLGRLTFGI